MSESKSPNAAVVEPKDEKVVDEAKNTKIDEKIEKPEAEVKQSEAPSNEFHCAGTWFVNSKTRIKHQLKWDSYWSGKMYGVTMTGYKAVPAIGTYKVESLSKIPVEILVALTGCKNVKEFNKLFIKI
jgi:hypothetical protein